MSGSLNSKNENKNKNKRYNHYQKDNFHLNNDTSNSNQNKSHQQKQTQISKQVRTQEKVVLNTKMMLDQLQNCFEVFGYFLPMVINAKKNSLSDMQAGNSLVVASINILGSMCVDEQQHKNTRGLNIASQHLATYVQGLNEQELEILQPFLDFVNCAVNGVKVPVLPAIEVDVKRWNSKSVNSIFSGLLGTGHVIGERHDGYRKNAKQINQQLEQEWRQNGQKGANISSGDGNGNGNGNGTHLPDANSLYSYSGANVKLSHEFKNNQFANAPLQAQMECQGEHDDEQSQSHNHNQNQGSNQDHDQDQDQDSTMKM